MDAKNDLQEFTISRVFDAPRELVWKCFTEAERMKQWWGPKGVTIDVSDRICVRAAATTMPCAPPTAA